MSDDNIIRLAATEKRMVVTMDKDFGELVYHSCMDHYGVLLLRLEDATVPEKLEVIKFLLGNYSSKIANCFCVFQKNKFRIKQIKKPGYGVKP
jgi:predicted nuclease of predicted toxin-antitoxin system